MISTVWRVITAPFRWIPWYVWLVLAGLAAWFGRNILVIIATIIAFHPIPVPPLFMGEPATVAEARAQDMQHFHPVRRNERSMDDAMRARFDAAVEDLSARAAELSDAAFQLELARVQAIIDNGHSNASATRMVAGFPRIPLRSAWIDGEIRVLRALPGEEALLGARVVQIGGVPVDAVLTRFRDAFGGNEPFYLSFAPLLLEAPDYLDAVWISDPVYRLELLDGSVIERRFEPVAPRDGSSRVFSGDLLQPWRSEDEGWVAFAPAGSPLYLDNPDNGYWYRELADLDAVYVSLRQNLSDDTEESLTAFVARAAEEIAAIGPSVIILDQRFNGGGDLTQTQPLMTAFADIVGEDGRIYRLANGNTFSAAIVNLAMVKEAAPEQTVLVGAPIGDRLQFWAEGWWFGLPNSGFQARYSTGYYDLQNGCSGLFICPWGSLHIFPVLVDDLDIDIPAPMTFASYAAGEDLGMAAIREAEANRR